MKDIASDLGVSVVTISKVLRGHADISASTRDRVLRRVRELKYEPNLAARSLVTGRSYMVGLVVPDLVHPFFGEVAKAITRVLRPQGYSLVISSSEEDAELENAEIEALLARQVDALIIASAQSSGERAVFEELKRTGTPYVLIDRNLPGLKAHYVGVDDEQIGFLAARHLVQCGCRRIAHIRGPDVSTAAGRLRGYLRAVSELGLDVPLNFVAQLKSADDRGEESGYEAMRHLLSVSERPDGVFCFNDETATGAMRAILGAGLRVPDDIAVIGVGNMRFTDLLTVPLSSIDQNNAQIGERAARVVLKLIGSQGKAQPRNTLVPVRLIQRKSTS